MDRRQLLTQIAAGLVLTPVLTRLASAAPDARELIAPDAQGLADRLAQLPQDRALQWVAQERPEPGRLRAALLLAGSRWTPPRAERKFNDHAILTLSATQAAEPYLDGADRWLPVLWALHAFKSEQPDAPPELPPRSVPGAQLSAAIAAAEEADAVAAVTALHRDGDRSALLRALALHATADHRFIGHRTIHLAVALQQLSALSWSEAVPVLSAVARGLALTYGDPADPVLGGPGPELWDAAQRWRPSGRAPDDTRRVLQLLRTLGPLEAALGVVAEPVSAAAIWEAIFASAADDLLAISSGSEGIAVVAKHGITTTHALHTLWRWAPDEPLRRQLLVRAVARAVAFRIHSAATPTSEPGPVAAPRAPGTRWGDVVRSVRDGEAFDDAHTFKVWAAGMSLRAHLGEPWRGRHLAACASGLARDAAGTPLHQQLRELLQPA